MGTVVSRLKKMSHRDVVLCARNYWLLVICFPPLSSVQSLSGIWLFATPWTAAHQASLPITNSRSLLKLMSIESVMPSSHLILCHPLLLLPSIFPSIGSFQMSQLFTSGGQHTGVSASASVIPMSIQDWSPLEWTGWISLQSKGFSRVREAVRIGGKGKEKLERKKNYWKWKTSRFWVSLMKGRGQWI